MTKLFGPGDQIGAYRITGAYPGGGLRALWVRDPSVRVHIEIRDAADWREQIVQLLRAASLLASLEHPGIARIVDKGVLEDQRPWIASELAEGVPLVDILARRTLAANETLALVRDLAAIAAYVHGSGLVHGAIDPRAVVMRTGERDFDVQLGAWTQLRAAGSASRGYAPEAITDGKADVHAIGVLAYRALTGRFPHVPELVPGVPGAASALIVKMLARDPVARPTASDVHASAGSLVADRLTTTPRARVRWTPAPIPQSGRCDDERIASILDLAIARQQRS